MPQGLTLGGKNRRSNRNAGSNLGAISGGNRNKLGTFSAPKGKRKTLNKNTLSKAGKGNTTRKATPTTRQARTVAGKKVNKAYRQSMFGGGKGIGSLGGGKNGGGGLDLAVLGQVFKKRGKSAGVRKILKDTPKGSRKYVRQLLGVRSKNNTGGRNEEGIQMPKKSHSNEHGSSGPGTVNPNHGKAGARYKTVTTLGDPTGPRAAPKKIYRSGYRPGRHRPKVTTKVLVQDSGGKTKQQLNKISRREKSRR